MITKTLKWFDRVVFVFHVLANYLLFLFCESEIWISFSWKQITKFFLNLSACCQCHQDDNLSYVELVIVVGCDILLWVCGVCVLFFIFFKCFIFQFILKLARQKQNKFKSNKTTYLVRLRVGHKRISFKMLNEMLIMCGARFQLGKLR